MMTTMTTADELVREWKQPSTRNGASVDHPSGAIVLDAPGRLAERSNLLTDDWGLDLNTWHTVSTPAVADQFTQDARDARDGFC
jgi:hypothetical protein